MVWPGRCTDNVSSMLRAQETAMISRQNRLRRASPYPVPAKRERARRHAPHAINTSVHERASLTKSVPPQTVLTSFLTRFPPTASYFRTVEGRNFASEDTRCPATCKAILGAPRSPPNSMLICQKPPDELRVRVTCDISSEPLRGPRARVSNMFPSGAALQH